MLDFERVTAPLSLRTRSGEPLLLLHGLGTVASQERCKSA